MSLVQVVAGIDGGGSKTLAVLAAPDGRIVGRGAAGASNYQGVGLAAAQAAIGEAVGRALAAAGLPSAALSAVCLGLAGAGRPEDQDPFRRWVKDHWPTARVRIANDAELVLAAGTPGGWGLAVIAGTGSIAYGRSPQGATLRAGGWGPLLGDEGSGYAIGREALRAAAAAHDGRAPATSLLPAILDAWGLPDATALVGKAYRPPLTPSEVAALAVVVENEADGGDPVAREILGGAGRELADTAAAVARRLALTGEVPCAVAGSVLVRGRQVREAFEAGLREAGVAPVPLVRVEEPALGAVRLALALLAAGPA